jgi:D-glycero-D-manno-heptose 1,7-bisphosphate phosphatase
LKHKAAFLDRDGVINKAILKSGRPHPPKDASELEILTGVAEAVGLLKKNGYEIVVISNQPDVARGITSCINVELINEKIRELTGIKEFFLCFHDDKDKCSCRKPLSGLIEKACLSLNLSIKDSFLVGDRWSDIKAGQTLGIRCYFLDNNYLEPQPVEPFLRVSSLIEAVRMELKE